MRQAKILFKAAPGQVVWGMSLGEHNLRSIVEQLKYALEEFEVFNTSGELEIHVVLDQPLQEFPEFAEHVLPVG